jgi:proton-coupled amino acid transporter
VLSLYALAVLFSYPLIVFPAVEILSKLFFKDGPVTTARKWKKNLFRFFLVCLTAGVAIGGGDDFEKFVSLVGGFACAPLGLIFPPIFHYVLVAETKREKIIDVVLAVIGTALGLFATIWAAYSWAVSG